MANRLEKEKSLYLRQHAENPVDWWPWCEEAFEEARRRDVPVILSSGYSACHWCHVMAHECFEDEYIAGLMNEHFVNIKLDREERPDIDAIYMEAVQMITQRGGWPLNVFLLPDKRPFFGGTYFPAEDRGQGIIPWPQLLMRVSDYFTKNRDDLLENAAGIVHNLTQSNEPIGREGGGGAAPGKHDLLKAGEAIARTHDDAHGGFGGAPKFPPSMVVDFLLALRSTQACERRPGLAERLDEVVGTTLRAMAMGGIYDQVGGGFARYSVDGQWMIPHFEKMLYDNGLLLDIYAKGYLRLRDPLFEEVVSETLGWLEREMRAPGGAPAYCASLDADSEGEEGKYYVWTPEQVKAVLGEGDGERFCGAYGITEEGNFEHGRSNPVLQAKSLSERAELAPLRGKLLDARMQRVAPARDPKVLLAWNALVLRGMAEAAFAFENAGWYARAEELADWLWDTFAAAGGRLRAVAYCGESGGASVHSPGRLDDYGNFAEALLAVAARAELFGSDRAAELTGRARQLVDAALEHFADPGGVGFFFTPDDGEELIARKKDWFDNAQPSGNSGLAHALVCLHALTGEKAYAEALDGLRGGYAGFAERAPNAVAHALSAFTQEAMGIGVIKVKGGADRARLRAALAARPWRRVFVLSAEDEPEQPEGLQLCVGSECREPGRDPEELAEML